MSLLRCAAFVLLLAGAGAAQDRGAALRSPPDPIVSGGTIGIGSPVRADDPALGIDCAGTRDGSAAVVAALARVPPGQTFFLPSGCRIGLASPGAGNTAVDVPGRVRIACQDTSAGFFAVHRRCVGGTYPDAACTTSAECLGGGTCAFDFGSTLFTPAGGRTYTMLKDTAGATDIRIEKCSIWTYQADPYQRCDGGAHDGAPCRQECSSASALPGIRCTADGDCAGGTCERRADCGGAPDGGGTCGAPPLSAVGGGRINPIDFARTAHVHLANVRVLDHFHGDFTIRTAGHAVLEDVNAAAEISSCTSPFSMPANSLCVGIGAARCCYGAFGLHSANTQPVTAVAVGVAVGPGSRLVRVSARGAANAITADGADVQVDESTAVPDGAHGPGTPGGGFTVPRDSTVSGSRLRHVRSMVTAITAAGAASRVVGNQIDGAFATGIALGGADSRATGNRIAGTAYTTGIVMAAGGQTAAENHIRSVNAANAIGIKVTGDNATLSVNHVAGNSTTGRGIEVGASRGIMVGNRIVSRPPDTLQYGVVFRDGDWTASANRITRPHDAGIWFDTAASTFTLTGNQVELTASRPTPSLTPVHILDDAGATVFPGALCQTEGDTCADGATCSGGPPATCQGGAEAGKPCCPGGAPTCTVRTPTPFLRVADYDVAGTTHTQVMISANTIFPASMASWSDTVMVDGVTSGTSAHPPNLTEWSITDNIFDGRSLANTYGVKFPTAGTITNVTIAGNTFTGLAGDVVNARGTYGALSHVPRTIATAADQVVSSTSYVDVTGLALALDAHRSYSFRCELQYYTSTGSTADGAAGFAMTGPGTPASFTYLREIAVADDTGAARLHIDTGAGDDSGTHGGTSCSTSAATPWLARISGTIVTGAAGGTLQARALTEGGSGAVITVLRGASCLALQVPEGT